MRSEGEGQAARGWRIGKPILPREHGAWAILYGSFLAGVGVAGRMGLPAVLLLLGITGLALANGPLSILSRGPAGAGARRRQALAWLVIYAALAAGALLPLLLVFQMRFLLPFGLAAAGFLAIRAFWLRGREERSLRAELLALAGLSMVGPVAHAVALGRVERVALLLWLLLLLFFASGIFYVRMRIQEMLSRRAGRRPGPALWPCLIYHLVLLLVVPGLAAAGLIPWVTLLAFAPVAWRAGAGLRPEAASLDVKRLGWWETARTAAFVLLLVGSFWIARLTA